MRIAPAVAAALLIVSPAALARDFGLDVSHFQGSTGIASSQWSTIVTAGASFAIIKATEGLTGPDDAAFANNVARASAAGLVTGAYHFPHAENRPTVAGAVLEADHFMSYAAAALGPGHLRPVLDLEGSSLSLSTSALTDWVLAFVNEVVAVKGPAATPIIYADTFTATSEVDARVANLDLWLAYYAGDPSAGQPPSTGNFNNWTLWQFSDTASLAGISPLDVDVVHSEYKPLSALLIPEPASLAAFAFTMFPLIRRRRPLL